MTVKERLKEFIRHKDLSDAEFTRIIDVSRGYVNSIDSSISIDKMNRISAHFPELNTEWLLLGKGKMLNNKNENKPIKQEGVPYYEDIESTGSILAMNQDNREIPAFYINYEHFNDCTAYLPLVGDSMYPKYCAGEIVAIKRIYNFDVVLWGEAYLIVTNENANNLRTVKLLHQHEDADKVILRASNPNYKGDTVINKQDIVSLFMVKGKITRNQL